MKASCVGKYINFQKYFLEVPEKWLLTQGFQSEKMSDIYKLWAPETMEFHVCTHSWSSGMAINAALVELL